MKINMNESCRLWMQVALLLCATIIVPSCSGNEDSSGNKPEALSVFVSIPPQEYFVKRICGSHVKVRALVEPGQSPHSYQPTPRQMEELGKSDIYFRIGVPFEDSVIKKIREINPDLKIVDSREHIKLIPFQEGHGHETGEKNTSKEEDNHGHEDSELDPHIWLDPLMVKSIVKSMEKELVHLDPENKEEYSSNAAEFLSELDVLHEELIEAMAPLKGRKFYVFHPAFGYFGHAYGLKQVAVETGGKEPSAKQLGKLLDQAKTDGVKVIFVQAQFPSKSAEAVAEAIGGVVVPIDPLATDYLDNMKTIGEKVQDALLRQ